MTISNITEEAAHGAAGNAPASDASPRPASAALTTPRERPILFSAPMVRALLAGVKTQTRRIVKLPSPDGEVYVDPGGTIFGPGPYVKNYPVGYGSGPEPMHPRIRCPYGYPGDRLWAKETHAIIDTNCWPDLPHRLGPDGAIAYYREGFDRSHGFRWRPSIHMPRWASRITLEVTGVRVERAHDISGRDVLAEGVDNGKSNPLQGERWENMQRIAFGDLWSAINGADSWNANPWVWAITFKRVA